MANTHRKYAFDRSALRRATYVPPWVWLSFAFVFDGWFVWSRGASLSTIQWTIVIAFTILMVVGALLHVRAERSKWASYRDLSVGVHDGVVAAYASASESSEIVKTSSIREICLYSDGSRLRKVMLVVRDDLKFHFEGLADLQGFVQELVRETPAARVRRFKPAFVSGNKEV